MLHIQQPVDRSDGQELFQRLKCMLHRLDPQFLEVSCSYHPGDISLFWSHMGFVEIHNADRIFQAN